MSNKRAIDPQTQLQLARTAAVKNMERELTAFVAEHPEARAELDGRVMGLARDMEFCENTFGIEYENPTVEDSMRLRYYAMLELKGKMSEGYDPREPVH